MRVPGVAYYKNNTLHASAPFGNRLLLRGGHVIDPANGLAGERDLLILDGQVEQVAENILPEKGWRVVDCAGLMVWPGLLDMHLHVHDLFEVTTHTAVGAAQDGVTLGLSPGAGNTFMAPALLGAEMDRGLPLSVGLLLGAGPVLACGLDNDQLVALFEGRLPEEIALQKLTRNPIANQTAPFTVGIKEHMGHALLGDENLERLYDVTSRARLLFMSHTQSARHTARVAALAKGRPLHLGHASAVGCEEDGAENLAEVLRLCKEEPVTAEFVTTMLRPRGGSREGLFIHPRARQICLDALASGQVDILVSDGQNHATMKGFGDTRDNIPAILELAQEDVLPLPRAVACMTHNPARLLAKRTGSAFWTEKLGHLGQGAAANVTVVAPQSQSAVYTIVTGRIVSFEQRLVRAGYGAGQWVFAHGMLPRMGVGDLPVFQVQG